MMDSSFNSCESSGFDNIWEHAIEPTFNDAYSKLESDTIFFTTCFVEPLYKDADGVYNEKYKTALNSEFQYLRNKFKLEFYNLKTAQQVEQKYLDFYKLASILCCAILRCKPFYFDVKKATEIQHNVITTQYPTLMEGVDPSKESVEQRKSFNLWLVDRSLVNYKVAFLAGRRMAALQVLADVAENEDAVVKILGSGLAQYPEKDIQDSYIVNMISGLAEAEARGREIDMLFLSMLYYQDGEYTRRIISPN